MKSKVIDMESQEVLPDLNLDMESRSCLLVHKWSRWSDVIADGKRTYFYSYGLGSGHTTKVEVPYQMRRCLRCNKIQHREVKDKR